MNRLLKNIPFGIRRAFSILPGNRERRWVFLVWLLYLLAFFAAMMIPSAQMWITDGLASLLSSPRYDLLLMGLAAILVNVVIVFFDKKKSDLWQNHINNTLSDSIYGDIIQKAARLKYKCFDNNEMYNSLTQTANNAPQKIAELITRRIVPPLVGGIGGILFVTATLLRIHWGIAVLITLGSALSIFFDWRKMKADYALQISQIPQRRWADAYLNALTGKQPRKEVSIFGLADYLTGKWKNHTEALARERFRLYSKQTILQTVTNVAAELSKTAALGFVVYLIVNGRTSAGAFMLVFSTIDVFSDYLSDISNAFITMGENSRHIDNWLEFMALEEEPQTETALSAAAELNIEFDHVRFKYDGAETYALDGLSLTIKQGERIAIVGENGSGKSTFVALLNGLYDDYEGAIRVNGVDIRGCAPELRKHIVSAFQDFGQYEFSLRDNITLGGAAERDDAVTEAAKKSGANEFIEPLERGLDTPIGSYEEGGINLSGGQWQKIAIARTLFRRDAKLIILDEPTAALDPQSESAVYRRFIERVNNQTAVLISHRLGATKFAGRILVFEKGRIVEEGDHGDLMARRGTYYTMYTAQAGMYRE